MELAESEAYGESVKGIGGRQNAGGMASIQIPFKELDLIINVEFMVMKGNIPTLLSIRGIMTDRLAISMQMCHIRVKDKVQPLKMVKVFLIHK